jgi:transposase
LPNSVYGRVKLSFEIAEYYRQYLNWKNTSADLLQDRKGRWWLPVVLEFETSETVATDEVVGVDLGIASAAVDSRGSQYGSEHWKEIEDRTFELRRRLQSKGTKSAKRHLKKLSGRQRRFRKDCDHGLSKRLARSVPSGATLVFEDLTNAASVDTLREGIAHLKLSFGVRSVGMSAMRTTTLRLTFVRIFLSSGHQSMCLLWSAQKWELESQAPSPCV